MLLRAISVLFAALVNTSEGIWSGTQALIMASSTAVATMMLESTLSIGNATLLLLRKRILRSLFEEAKSFMKFLD